MEQVENINGLVEINNNQVVVSSRDIAEHFEKEHKNVLRNIDELVAQNSATKDMFLEATRNIEDKILDIS